MVSPGDVAEAFVKANPGLSHADLAVACGGKRLSEVRICMTKDFAFRDCAEVVKQSLPARQGRHAGGARWRPRELNKAQARLFL